MFEEIIQQKSRDIIEQISIKNNSINLFEIQFNPKVDQYVKTFMVAEVDWWIYEEDQARNASERFNLQDPKLSAFIVQYNELLKKNAIFTADTLKKVINDAVTTRLNALIRPRVALKWFVFRWEQSRPYHEIVKRLNYIDDYKYLADGFVQYVANHQTISKQDDLITFHQFDRIISEVDNQKLEDLTPEDLISLLSPLFEFFNKKTKILDSEKIPIEAIIIFFDDKNMKLLSDRLENLYKTGELLHISKKYLLGFIYKTLYELDNMYGESSDLLTNITNEINEGKALGLDNVDIPDFNIQLDENINDNIDNIIDMDNNIDDITIDDTTSEIINDSILSEAEDAPLVDEINDFDILNDVEIENLEIDNVDVDVNNIEIDNIEVNEVEETKAEQNLDSEAEEIGSPLILIPNTEIPSSENDLDNISIIEKAVLENNEKLKEILSVFAD